MHKKYFQFITFLSILGIGLALYLWYSQTFKPAFQPCYVNSLINCDAVIKTEVGYLFGIPVPIIGLIGYIAILLGSLFKKSKFTFGMALFGTLFCLRITIIDLFIVKTICPVCLTCQAVMLMILYFTYKILQKKNT